MEEWELTYTDWDMNIAKLNWGTMIYTSETLPPPGNSMDCSFLCKRIHAPTCDLFMMTVRNYFLKLCVFVKQITSYYRIMEFV